MKQADVKVGQVYWANVSGFRVRVRILNVSRFGGWDAKNLSTDRIIRIKTAGRLHGEAKGG